VGQAQTLTIAQGIVTMLQAMPATLLTTCSQLITASGSPQTVAPLSMTGITTGVPFLIDVSNSEVVTPSATTGSTFTAIFTKQHLPNWTIGSGGTLFSSTSVFLGYVQDPTDVTPCVSVTLTQRHMERFDTGYKANSHPTFLVETLADLTDANAAETFILSAGDILMSVFMARATIPNATQAYMVYGGQFKKDIPPEIARYKVFPSGRVYRAHQMQVQAIDQFNVQFN
jgi:hypothetical protein